MPPAICDDVGIEPHFCLSQIYPKSKPVWIFRPKLLISLASHCPGFPCLPLYQIDSQTCAAFDMEKLKSKKCLILFRNLV